MGAAPSCWHDDSGFIVLQCISECQSSDKNEDWMAVMAIIGISHCPLVPLLIDMWADTLIPAIINKAAMNIGLQYLFG